MAYQVTLPDVLDAGFDPRSWRSGWRDWDWRAAWFLRREAPPSWRLADAAIEAGAQSILFPSLAARGGINLVDYRAALIVPGNVLVHDPDGHLPRYAQSWPSSSTDA